MNQVYQLLNEQMFSNFKIKFFLLKTAQICALQNKVLSVLSH